MSVTLTPTQQAGLRKVGDILIPGEGDLPSFSASGCAAAMERMLPYMSESDRKGVTALLTIFRYLPGPVVRGIMWLTERHRSAPEPLAAVLRLVNLGIKGVVMTLYYSDVGSAPCVYRTIGWDAHVSDAPPVPGSPPRVLPQPPPPPAPATPSPADVMERGRLGARSLRRLSLAERLGHLEELQRLVLTRREEIVERIQADTRKSRSDALVSEIFGVLDNLHWLRKHAAKALRDRKQPTPIALLGKTSWTWYEPLGTILVIAPWNYPFYQAIVPIACAFAAGNSVVYKPSEWTPLTGLVEDLLSAAQFAPNWVQVAYGDGSVGAALVEQRPSKVFFTGSTRTGRRILAQAAPHLIPVELELGGKDPMIVFDDVDVTRAAAGAAWGALTNTGQSCTSVERVYVQRPIYERFRAALVRELQRLKQEIDRDGDADLGAMTTDFQVKIVADQVADARSKGARFLTGADWDGRTNLIPPMVVDGVTPDMQVAREETFGPLIPLVPFDTEDEVVRLANDSEYGLTASVWTADAARAVRVSRALEVGGVSINNVMATEANPALPFGGTKHSGFGRYKGEHGLHAFCNVKSVLVDKNSAKIEANWYPYTREKYALFTKMMVSLFSPGIGNFLRFVVGGMKLESYSKKAHAIGRTPAPRTPSDAEGQR